LTEERRRERRTEKNRPGGMDRGWEGGRKVQREDGKGGQLSKGQTYG